MILQGFIYMVLGMVMVFAFLIILVLTVTGMSLLFKREAAGRDEEGVAVALAAVSSYQNKQ